MAQRYKGFDVLLGALRRCAADRLAVTLVLIGDGKYRVELEALAARLGVDRLVLFVGQLPSGAAVRKQLDRADLFVMPSRTEGMPSAMIEAMARGLPCLGSAVGGIPELLDSDDLVVPGDASALAAKIRDVVSNPARMARMGARNLQKVRNFHETELRKLRTEFYHHVRHRTEAWQRSNGPVIIQVPHLSRPPAA